MAILDDFEKVFMLGNSERGKKQIVKDEQIDFGQAGEGL